MTCGMYADSARSYVEALRQATVLAKAGDLNQKERERFDQVAVSIAARAISELSPHFSKCTNDHSKTLQ